MLSKKTKYLIWDYLSMLCLACVFWFCVFLLFCLSPPKAKGNTIHDFAFLILIEEAECVKTKQGIDWQDYQKQAKLGWPNGGLVYVSSLNCRACRIVERDVFTSPTVIEEMNSRVVCKPDVKYAGSFTKPGAKTIRTPSLIFIAKGGAIEKRALCPQTVKSFLALVRSKKSQKQVL